MGAVGNGTVGTADDSKYRRKPDMYNLGIDDEYLNDHPMYTLPGSNTLGYMGSGSQMPGMETIRQNHQPMITDHYGDIKSPVVAMTTSPGNVPLGSSMQEQYRYMNGRFVMITDDKGDDSDDAVTTESRPSSIQESQSSRKSLTKVWSHIPKKPIAGELVIHSFVHASYHHVLFHFILISCSTTPFLFIVLDMLSTILSSLWNIPRSKWCILYCYFRV